MAELKRCPECGGVATVIHMYDTYDRADFGWAAGCGRYRAGDGLHTKKMKVSGMPSKKKQSKHGTGGRKMAEYIEKNVAIARVTALEIGNPCATMTDAKRQIADTRPADVAPVVHGQWVSVAGKRDRICSRCLRNEPYKNADDDAEVFEFCPHCGAKMDGGAE